MPRTILLADDSPTIRRLVTQTFADANIKIIEVNNGDAAIKMFEEVQPDAVLADIYMPGKNGYQVCAHVRSHPELGRTPVVLLVGAFDAFDEAAAKNAGATASITKPFSPGALIELVNSIIPAEPRKGRARPEAERRPEPEPQPAPQPVAAPAPAFAPVPAPAPALDPPLPPPPAPVPAAVSEPVAAGPAAAPPAVVAESDDLLGLEAIFKDEPHPSIGAMTAEDIDRIADRVIQRVSSQVIESIAWDVVPDITERIVREELKRLNEG